MPGDPCSIPRESMNHHSREHTDGFFDVEKARRAKGRATEDLSRNDIVYDC